ncbi:MAG: ABC transporter permease [Cyanobacteriota/Melainabacteria group bacterium]
MTVELESRKEIAPTGASAFGTSQSVHEELGTLKAIANLWNLRNLTWLMVQREFTARYKGSILGSLWPVLNPIGHMALYTFLFSVILQVRFGSSLSMSNFALYLMCGFLPWTAMSEALSSSSTKILEMPNLVKRVVFPLEILPLINTITSFLTGMIAIVLLCIFASIYQQTAHATMLLLPMIIIPQFLFTVGLSWLLSGLGVFIRDIRHFTALFLSAWMYATPIVYPADKIPENLQFLLWINPVAGMVTDYRRLILEGTLPDMTSYLVYTSVSVILFVLGFKFFYSVKKSFADVM